MNGATVSVETDGDCRHDGGPLAVRMAVEGFLYMFEAGLHSDPAPGQERELCGVASKAFQRGKAVDCRELADGVHAGVKVVRRKPEAALPDFGNTLPHFGSHLCQRVLLRHYRASKRGPRKSITLVGTLNGGCA